jgi:uncharacterized membrane protein
MSGKALFRLGMGLILGAAAFFLRYTLDRLGPEGKAALVAGFGLAMVVTGIQVAAKRPGYGHVLQGVGAAVLYLTGYAVHHTYGLVDTTTAFLLLAGVSAGLIALSVRQRSEPLAAAGLLGALVAPVVIDGHIAAFPGDSGYVATVLVVASWLLLARGWVWTFAGSLAGAGLVLGLGAVAGAARADVQFGLAALWLMWPVSLLAAARHPGDARRATILPAAVSVMVPVGVFAATSVLWEARATTLIGLGMAAAQATAALALPRTRVPSFTAAFQWAPATVLSTLAWTSGLEPGWLPLVLGLHAAGLIVVGLRESTPVMVWTGHVLALVTAVLWPITLLAAADSSLRADDVATGLVVVTAAAVSVATGRRPEPHGTLGVAYGLVSIPAALVWAALVLGPLPQGTGWVTAAWTAVGVTMIVTGRILTVAMLRNGGIAISLLAVAKLLVHDTAAASPPARIALFAGVGVVLAAVGYWLGGDEPPPEEKAAPVIPPDRAPSHPLRAGEGT